ncbi:MAG TPA: TIGR03435 family protein [Vicinamibacterales bacterium]|nr:TIGR03435 family protein [Vicinamibacterales bacterium]
MRMHALLVTLVMIPGVIAAQQFTPASPGPPVDPNTRFEVVSVKPVPDAIDRPGRFLPILPRFEFTQLPIGWLVRQALQKPDYQMIGAPDWIDTDPYTIMAKAPDGTTQAALTTLILNLLKDRFQLATHLETRELPIFHLVMARTDGRPGPDLKATPADCQKTVAERNAAMQAAAAGRGAPPPMPPLPDLKAPPPCGFARLLTGNVAVSGRTIAQFVQTLSDWVGRPVIDKTGLTSLFDFTLKFAPEGIRAGGPMGPTLTRLMAQAPAAPADPDAPSLSVALQEQLGLRLESARGPVEVVVIDRLEKPTPD